ncbi:MAG TPA: hypothetical protein VND43_02410 [Burkholderiales bacterium]|nr:hypothetical protein [Burkholderiales bacterium]
MAKLQLILLYSSFLVFSVGPAFGWNLLGQNATQIRETARLQEVAVIHHKNPDWSANQNGAQSPGQNGDWMQTQNTASEQGISHSRTIENQDAQKTKSSSQQW